MICSIKAQAEASGLVSKVIVANRNGGPAEQIADLRNLISAGANAIIINPSDREALNPVIKQAAAKGIVVVAVDQAVSAPEAYVLSNDQVAYGKRRRELAVQAARRQGQRGRDARHRRRAGRRRPPPGLHRGAEGLSRTSRSTLGLHRLGAEQDGAGRPRTCSAPASRSTASGPRARSAGGRRLQDRQQALRAGGRRRQQRLRRPAHRAEGQGPRRARRSPTRRRSAAPASRSRSTCCRRRTSRMSSRSRRTVWDNTTDANVGQAEDGLRPQARPVLRRRRRR